MTKSKAKYYMGKNQDGTFVTTTGISSVDRGAKASPTESGTGAFIVVLQASSYKGYLELSTCLQDGGGKVAAWKRAVFRVEIRARTSIRNVTGTLLLSIGK